MATTLFDPLQLGAISLSNRIVMAPLTRSRAGSDGVPSPLAIDYYAQRATAGLIITEATNISPEGRGYAYTPGIYTPAQVAGWRKITDAVHAKGGRIVCQLWHVGRISHPDLQPDGQPPVAPSAIRPEGNAFTEDGFKPHVTPRALTLEDIDRIIGDYAHATRCAREAGFDGVEIHAANGYLIDQFLKDKTNQRTDDYGGSIENRSRFLIEVTEAVVGAWDADHVGIRLSPISPANDIDDSDPEPVFTQAVEQLKQYNLAFLEMVEGATGGPREVEHGFDLQNLVDIWQSKGGKYIANNGYTRDLAIEHIETGKADAIAFGKPFISNPDLVERLQNDISLATPDPKTFYGGGAEGYTDYPRAS